jgi:hypothetical protein
MLGGYTIVKVGGFGLVVGSFGRTARGRAGGHNRQGLELGEGKGCGGLCVWGARAVGSGQEGQC